MEWKNAVAEKISQTMFLKSTKNFDGLKVYVKSQIENLCRELSSKTGNNGGLEVTEHDDGTYDYIIPSLDEKEKGFQVEYNERAQMITIRIINNLSEHNYSTLAEIKPKHKGAIVKHMNSLRDIKDEELISSSVLDAIFEKALT
ncbi:hypothetical protein [Exiguobacterium sp. s138]|uniref:hypothetical protein n=1 Tax=Exiguobacterium sp. s138 TaxID=2751202 RepID=UPI001BE96DE7|nr:hypothetical protein [Exiguobacterium sp. s138]